MRDDVRACIEEAGQRFVTAEAADEMSATLARIVASECLDPQRRVCRFVDCLVAMLLDGWRPPAPGSPS